MTPELTEAEIDAILREKARVSAHRRYMLNRERYKRRANIRYHLMREEVLAAHRERYANDPAFRETKLARARKASGGRSSDGTS